jgi:hypothetical protein
MEVKGQEGGSDTLNCASMQVLEVAREARRVRTTKGSGLICVLGMSMPQDNVVVAAKETWHSLFY